MKLIRLRPGVDGITNLAISNGWSALAIVIAPSLTGPLYSVRRTDKLVMELRAMRW